MAIQRALSRTRAFADPSLLPGPFLFPDAFCAAACLILPLEVPFLALALMVPEFIAVRMSARVMHSATSSMLLGSIQTLFSPHLRISAAILFWLLRLVIFTPSC